jgi:hypothetical protein
MSKKNKAKFKRQVKNQVSEQISQAKSDNIKSTLTTSPIVNTPKVMPWQNGAVAIMELQNLPQIKADLKKTGMVVGLLALTIVALAISDQKYHILTTFGAWLFKVLNIG